ncbi:GXWXG domain-containing protein [Nocardia sp. NPDC004278]
MLAGEQLDTGHPFAGALVASGRYGNQFDDPESVHPLLFADASGNIFAVDSRRVPLGLAAGRAAPPGP